MNRTREYTKIVQTSSVPQETLSKIQSPLLDLFVIDTRIKSHISDITKCKYELYNVRSKINEVQNMCQEVLNRLKSTSTDYGNDQEEEVYNNIYNILRGRINEYKLVILTYLRKSEKEEKEKQKRRSKYNYTEEKNESTYRGERESTYRRGKSTHLDENEFTQRGENESTHRGERDLHLHESQSAVQQEALFEEEGVRMRRHQEISQQISEIGSIMEEIGIHVSLQEESFKRVDDLMRDSEKILDSSVHILKRVLEGLKGARGTHIKYFIFWIVLALIFWMFRLR